MMIMAVLIIVVVTGRKIIESQPTKQHHMGSRIRITQLHLVTLVPVNERLLASRMPKKYKCYTTVIETDVYILFQNS